MKWIFIAKFAPKPVLTFKDDKKNDFIKFHVETQITFEEHERDSEWVFRVNYHDSLKKNALIHSITRYITPKKAKIKQKFNEKASREEIKIDMTKTDVSIKMQIIPKEP